MQMKDTIDFVGMNTSSNRTEFYLGIGSAQTLFKESLEFMLKNLKRFTQKHELLLLKTFIRETPLSVVQAKLILSNWLRN